MLGPTTTRHRRHFSSRKSDIQDGGKGDPDTPSKAVTALLGEVQSKRYSTGYLTIRDDRHNTISFANGVEVMRKDEWGGPDDFQKSQSPRRSVSARRFHQVKQSIFETTRPIRHQAKHSISESTKLIAAAIEEHFPIPPAIKRSLSTQSKKRNAKGKKPEPVVPKHNPYQVFGKPPTKLDIMVEKSKTLASIVGSVKSFDIRPKPRVPPNRDWDRRGQEPVLLKDWKREDISKWYVYFSSSWAMDHII